MNGASTICTQLLSRYAKIPTEDCQKSQGGFLFQFDLSLKTQLTSPPTLTLKGCSFKNFFQEFNSLIETNAYGGHIVIQDTTFERISSCGAVIRNFRQAYKHTLLTAYIPANMFYFRTSTFQEELYTEDKAWQAFTSSPFKANCSDNP